MGPWLHRVASLKIAVALLVVVLASLAAGTIVESRHGAEDAGRLVYGAPWFRVLLALFALNVAAAIVDLRPWGRYRVGFVLTHGSMLVILFGAWVTDRDKIEGQLALWEGQTGDVFLPRPAADGTVSARYQLPFSVRLDAFEIDYYQGTRQPAMFRSRVTVRDGSRSFPAVIEMNHELAYGGYRLFQSSYQQAPGRNQTILSVSRDPGQAIVFGGYALLLAGMITVLATRILQRREAALAAATAAFLALLLLPVSAHAASVPDPVTVEALRRLPVQHDGRVMPFDTVAREGVWNVTGRNVLWGIDPVALTLGWAFDPEGWMAEPLVPVDDPGLKRAIGLPAPARRASFRELVGNARLLELVGEARAAAQAERPLSPLLRSAQKLEGRLLFLQPFLDRSILRVIPSAAPGAAWSVPARLQSPADLLGVLGSGVASGQASGAAIEREIRYNRVRPTRLAWWILTAATLLSILAWNVPRRFIDLAAGAALLAGFGVMSWGLGTRWQIAGRIPASNMYESLLFLGWGVGFFALVAFAALRIRLVILNAAAMAALTTALTDLLPVDPYIHPMPPVLSGTPWLAIHVPIIMLSYAVLALGVLVAHMQIGFNVFTPGRPDLSARMSDLLYWYIQVGCILLIAGILTGSIWAASSWGRYWGWDPKEVWSLVAFLAYVAILHGRFDRFIGPFGVAALSIGAFWAILMTYLGVNFVLASGLHSYGFGGGAVVRWMLIVAAAEIVFVAAGWARRRPRAAGPAASTRPSSGT